MTTTVRLAVEDDIPALGEIERAAGGLFRDIGMAPIADDEPLPDDVLIAGVKDGRLWVAVETNGSPVAYLLALRIGNLAHVEQVTVHPAYARQGIGGRLLATCREWAEGWDAAAFTLTTFRDVPWNAPYYERIGFRIVPDEGVPAGIRRIVEDERHAGLHRWPRVVMAYAKWGSTRDVLSGVPNDSG